MIDLIHNSRSLLLQGDIISICYSRLSLHEHIIIIIEVRAVNMHMKVQAKRLWSSEFR